MPKRGVNTGIAVAISIGVNIKGVAWAHEVALAAIAVSSPWVSAILVADSEPGIRVAVS